MATNYIQPGDTIRVAAPYDLASGAGALVGSIFGVALAAADFDASEEVELQLTGVWSLAKTSAQAWSVGNVIYWDNTNKECTTSSAGNTRIGVAVEAAANPSSTGKVLLVPDISEGGVLKGSAALDFGSISAAASADLTITVTGAAVGDPVSPGLPAAPEAGLIFMMFVSAANTVTVRATNITASPVDAASATYTCAVHKQ